MSKMGSSIRRLSAVLLCFQAVCMHSYAVPAKPTAVEYKQPDGSSFTLFIRGDERNHYYVTPDGYPMLPGTDGMLYYATVSSGQAVPSDVRANEEGMRSAYEQDFLLTLDKEAVLQGLEVRKRLSKPRIGIAPRKITDFPTIGVHKALVILVEYSDVAFSLEDPQDYFYRMLNEPGFSDNGGTGSARDYYIQNSDSLYLPDFDVFGPVTLSKPMSYYGANDWYGNDLHPEQMAYEACMQLDDVIDFADYDSNGDGKVDNVYIFYAGYGEASGGGANTVWPHSWSLTSAGVSLVLDNKQIDHYACSNEKETGSMYDGIGTFCHEYGHVLGLPDLYATRYTSAFTPGDYSLMDGGSYNNDSRTPPALSAYERYELNWLTPKPLLVTDTVVVLPHIMNTNQAYILTVGKNLNEYYLIENRQQTGWDEYIPGHGMLIWHIDYNKNVWDSNEVNNNPNHQYVDIIEADNIRTESTRAGDTFPGTAGVTEISGSTTPALETWDGTKSDRRIYEIAESGDTVTFRFMSTGIEYVAPEPETVDITPVSATICWNKVPDAVGYILNVYRMKNDVPVSVLLNIAIGDVDSYQLTDLIPATVYYYTMRSQFETTNSPMSAEMSFVTSDPTFEFLAPIVHESSVANASGFVASWEPMEEAQSYQLYVYTKQVEAFDVSSYDFTEKIAGLPQGWSTTCNSCYGVAGYYGEAFPSLRMNSDGQYLRTLESEWPVYDFEFWYRGISVTDSGCKLRIMGYNRTSELWEQVDEIEVTDESSVYRFDGFTDKFYAVSIELDRPGSGSVVIDDVKVRYADVSITMLEGYDGLQLEECSCTVTGIDSSQAYYYKVRAYNGEVYSLLSEEVYVTVGSGVKAVEAPSVSVRSVAGAAIVTNLSAQPVEAALYTLQGVCVASYVLPSGPTRIALPVSGVYLLRVGTECYKIVG